MKSILIGSEDQTAEEFDLLDLDPEFLNAVAGGSGGQECCQSPTITERIVNGQSTATVDCYSGWRNC